MRRKIDVLKVVQAEESVVSNRVAGLANINHVELTLMLSELETKELVSVKVIGKRERPYKQLVYITENGSTAIREYESLCEKLGEIA